MEEQNIYFYDWENKGKCIGSISSTHKMDTDDMGISFYSENDCNVILGIKDTNTDRVIIEPVIRFNNSILNGSTPYIRNTANGTLFGNNKSGGIQIENGLIKSWSLSLPNFELENIIITGIKVVDGLIDYITYQQN